MMSRSNSNIFYSPFRQLRGNLPTMKILRIIYAIALPVLVVTGISCKKTEETVQETQGAAAVKDIDELIQFRRETRQLYNNRKFA